MAQFLCNEGSKFDTPLARRLVADLNTALVKQFLDIPRAQWETMVKPNYVSDDAHRESVTVEPDINYGCSTYLNPVEATQSLRSVTDDQPLALKLSEPSKSILPLRVSDSLPT